MYKNLSKPVEKENYGLWKIIRNWWSESDFYIVPWSLINKSVYLSYITTPRKYQIHILQMKIVNDLFKGVDLGYPKFFPSFNFF